MSGTRAAATCRSPPTDGGNGVPRTFSRINVKSPEATISTMPATIGQVDSVAEQNIAEHDRPDHLTILCRADIGGRSLTRSPHRQHIGYGGEESVTSQFHPLIRTRRPEVRKRQQTANNDSTKN